MKKKRKHYPIKEPHWRITENPLKFSPCRSKKEEFARVVQSVTSGGNSVREPRVSVHQAREKRLLGSCPNRRGSLNEGRFPVIVFQANGLFMQV